MYPDPVDAIPTPSTKTFPPTENGKDPAVENPVFRLSVTSFVMVLNPTVSIPTPFGLFTVRRVGTTSERFLAFSLIKISEIPPFFTLGSRTTFSTFLLVIASITTILGSML